MGKDIKAEIKSILVFLIIYDILLFRLLLKIGIYFVEQLFLTMVKAPEKLHYFFPVRGKKLTLRTTSSGALQNQCS